MWYSIRCMCGIQDKECVSGRRVIFGWMMTRQFGTCQLVSFLICWFAIVCVISVRVLCVCDFCVMNLVCLWFPCDESCVFVIFVWWILCLWFLCDESCVLLPMKNTDPCKVRHRPYNRAVWKALLKQCPRKSQQSFCWVGISCGLVYVLSNHMKYNSIL